MFQAATVSAAQNPQSLVTTSIGNNASLPTNPFTSASSVVDSSLSSMQALLSGEGNAPSVPSTIFTSPSLPIDARVSDKIKSKIWNNEFIDFGVLLSNPITEGKFQITISSSKEAEQAMCLEPLTRTKKIFTLENWLRAFHVFVGVYTRKYPHEAPALMKYGHVIQSFTAKGGNWTHYDDNFRFFKTKGVMDECSSDG